MVSNNLFVDAKQECSEYSRTRMPAEDTLQNAVVNHIATQYECYVVENDRLSVQHPEFQWVSTCSTWQPQDCPQWNVLTFNHIKYANLYLAEFSYHFNRRFDLAAMATRLLRAAVPTNPIPIGYCESQGQETNQEIV